MEREVYCGKTELEGTGGSELEYYIIPECISSAYCDLMRYGIKVKKTTYFEGGGKTVETQQINNVFYRKDDAERFMELIMRGAVTPVTLRDVVEDYIAESVANAGKSA